MNRKQHKRDKTSWIYLNNKGKKIWGGVFPSGKIPVLSWIPKRAELGEGRKVESVYTVYLPEISDEVLKMIVEKMVKAFDSEYDFVEKYLLSSGLVIRESLISGSGTDNLGLLL